MKLVSTIFCTYNAEKYIKWTLDSILSQTYKNQEILIRDDGSTDRTIDIIKEYQKKDNRIKLWTSKKRWKKLWPYWWLNFLLDKSKWEYIAIQDHDDIWHPEKLKKQVDFLNKNANYIWCWNNVLVFFEKDKNWYIFKPSQKNHIMHTSLMFRNIWVRYRENKDLFLEDLFFQRKILLKQWDIYNIDEVLSLHLIKNNGSNLSREWWKLNFNNLKKIINLYWIWKYWIQILIVFILKKMFPNFFLKKEKYLLNKKYWILPYNKLSKWKDTKKLLSFLKF